MHLATDTSASRTRFLGWLVCIGLAVVFWGGIVILAVAFVLPYFHGPPHLPGFAYPQGSGVVKVEELDSDCGGAVGGLPCHRLTFRAATEFGDQQPALMGEFAKRGWSVSNYRAGADGKSYVMTADSRSDDICIYYLAHVGYERLRTPADVQRPFVIEVDVTNCSDIKY